MEEQLHSGTQQDKIKRLHKQLEVAILMVLGFFFLMIVVRDIEKNFSGGSYTPLGERKKNLPSPKMLHSEELPFYLVGKNYVYPLSFEIIEKYGSPETLAGTDPIFLWVAYFPKGNFTLVIKKEENRILRVVKGRSPQ